MKDENICPVCGNWTHEDVCADEYVLVKIKRPDGYNDVAAELVVEDFIESAKNGGFTYEVIGGQPPKETTK